jgi:polysaccharide pyruvyl transferase WcaK-like protein
LASFSDEDDRTHCKRIYELVRNKKSTRIVKGNYAADEIKWLIGKCDLFIGCRMHSTIASTSMCVPTIPVAYGEKFEGVIGDAVGQSSQIVRIDTDHKTFLSQLELVILQSWERRNEIRKELEKRIAAIKESAQAPVLLIKEILDSLDRE